MEGVSIILAGVFVLFFVSPVSGFRPCGSRFFSGMEHYHPPGIHYPYFG